MKVAIFDAYPYLYAGEYATDWSISGFPIGGFRNLMDKVLYECTRKYFPIVVFDPRCKIQNANREYKAGRKPNMAIWAQAQMAEEYLNKIGIATFCEEGYEADDVICAIAEELSSSEHDYIEIVVYTSDLDLAHCVNSVTRVLPATSAGKAITAGSFSSVCSTANQLVYYNTISAFKVFTGCKSDNIKPMPNGKTMYERFKTYITEDLGYPESPELRHSYFMYKFCEDVLIPDFGFGEEQVGEYLKRVDLVFPRPYKNPYSIGYEELARGSYIKNEFMAGEVAKMTRCKSVKAALGLHDNDLAEETKKDIQLRAELLTSGTFAVSAEIPPEFSILEDFGRRF